MKNLNEIILSDNPEKEIENVINERVNKIVSYLIIVFVLGWGLIELIK